MYLFVADVYGILLQIYKVYYYGRRIWYIAGLKGVFVYCRCICLLWKTSCTLLFQMLKLPFTYTCASWLQMYWRTVFF